MAIQKSTTDTSSSTASHIIIIMPIIIMGNDGCFVFVGCSVWLLPLTVLEKLAHWQDSGRNG
jgi:hypothetical protein